MNLKQLAAEKAVEQVESGMIVGLGTGSTAYWAIEKIGEKVKSKQLNIKAIATSKRSEEQARGLGIPIISFAEIDAIDITIDGADESDHNLHLIKGGGGALLREKIVASNSRKLVIVADESKLVQHLGKYALPVDVVTFGWEKTFQKLEALGCIPKLRLDDGKPYLTDNANYILDCAFGEIHDPATLHEKINAITGVVDNGLFINLASQLIIASAGGEIKTILK
ncbi:MAG: ribose-5-phosphate isomerase RpiA [Bacteroidetes bacterium]|nr:ribose-5-phosphate isomerase RpiA [Bacteroidota bacterium]MBS1935156.1 ribose-5-phosphate isomerase RpiA [Bacteroidota bacterium]